MNPPTHVHTYRSFTCKHAHIAPHVCVSRLTHKCDWRLGAGVPLPWPRWTCWVGGSARPVVTAWSPATGGSGPLCRVVPWVLSPLRPTLSLVLASWHWYRSGPHCWSPVVTWGTPSLPPLPWERPHTHRDPTHTRHLRLLLVATSCFALINSVS